LCWVKPHRRWLGGNAPEFKILKAADAIDLSVFVYEGRFEIPLAAALAHAQKAGVFLAGKRLPEALQEAQQAVALAPDSAGVNAQMGNVLDALGRREEARLTTQLHCD
jgi:tetratricopeptide (TPR) repeat protein